MRLWPSLRYSPRSHDLSPSSLMRRRCSRCVKRPFPSPRRLSSRSLASSCPNAPFNQRQSTCCLRGLPAFADHKVIWQTIRSYMNRPDTIDTMAEIVDDKAVHVIPFILELLESFEQSLPDEDKHRPFFIGLNGIQGAGKTVLVSILLKILTSEPYNLPTVVFSLDDFYLTHADQIALAKSHPDNPLLHHRGQPGTHDVPLALQVFQSLKRGLPTKIPQYDKAAFDGQGDREPESQWRTVNQASERKIKVVLFEGWCVGFRSIDDSSLKAKHDDAVRSASATPSSYTGRLAHNSLQSAMDINNFLKQYDALTTQLDAFIHVDASNPQFVYEWRRQQERGLREKKGAGMTDEQVVKFVDGYYPAYELFTETVRDGVFGSKKSSIDDTLGLERQIRLEVDKDRKVVYVEKK